MRIYSVDLRQRGGDALRVSYPIAIVMSEVFLRRLTPALMPFVKRQQDYRVLSIHRPVKELKTLLEEIEPAGLITEWLPEKTEAILAMSGDSPTVIVDTDYCYPGVLSVDVDDHAVGREAARAFVQAGFRSFACLGNGMPYSDQRIEGFQEALPGDSGVCRVHHEPGFEETRYSESIVRPSSKLKRWLQDLPKPVGIFAVHDPLGRFLCGTCRELELEIPTAVAVIGANNDPLVCGLTHPMLSSVVIPWDSIGALAGESMQKMIAGDSISTEKPHLISPSGVVLRHSANHLAIDDPLLRRAMSFLSERIQDSISIGGMCSEMRVARRTLERKFREHFHCTPWEMLCQMRVNQAKQLLAETNHPLSLISELCGFNDPERMAVVFKRVTGKPPSHHRMR